jgi:small-conductance mechanosensitive channel
MLANGIRLGALGALVALASLSATAADPAKPATAATPAQPTSGTAAAPPPQPSFPLTSDQVAAHVGESVDWFHHLAPIEQLQVAAADSATRERLHQQSLTAVRLAFQFGKACAALLNAEARQTTNQAASATTAKGVGGQKGFAGRLDQAVADVAQRIDTLQSQLDALKEKMTHARARELETLKAQVAQINAALRLAHEVQASVQDMQSFQASSLVGDNRNLSPLEGQLADMERSIPELRGLTQGAASGKGPANGPASNNASSSSATGTAGSSKPSTGAAHPADNFREDNAGVIALVTQWLSLHDMRNQLGAYIKETGDLQDEIEKVRTPLVGQVRSVVGDDLTISTSTDPAQLAAQRDVLESDTNRFKQLSTVLVPLGEQALTVDTAMSTLDDWRSTLESRMASVARYLAIRIGIVLGWVAVVLIVSDVWRRATFRYLHDLRRRRQFLVLRRVVVAIALTLVVIFGLVSEIGSIATYIGFVTAGIAVALQNVILAIVAYFFLIGRYGVRVGDRITMAGVTGRVVDISLVRIYLMELAGADLHATGRMVVLSNAVLFQPTALFKQIPGADFVWHTVTLTIAGTADVSEAHKRLEAAAEKVYSKYRPAIERQHALVQRFIDFDASSPQPEVRLRLTENGLECSVRYPVELENAAAIDQQMLKALRDALEHDSQFKLVATGAVVLRSSDS